jgi:protoporphyrinogen oxidase
MLKYADPRGIYFQKTVCTLFSLKKKLSDMYWVNIGDDLSFKALIEHTNLIPYERYGEHLLYAVVYSSHPIDPDLTLASFKEDLRKYGIGEGDINWHRTFYETATAPMYNRSYRFVPYESGIKGLYFAGLFSRPNHSGRLVNGSILAGKEVADILNKKVIASQPSPITGDSA